MSFFKFKKTSGAMRSFLPEYFSSLPDFSEYSHRELWQMGTFQAITIPLYGKVVSGALQIGISLDLLFTYLPDTCGDWKVAFRRRNVSAEGLTASDIRQIVNLRAYSPAVSVTLNALCPCRNP